MINIVVLIFIVIVIIIFKLLTSFHGKLHIHISVSVENKMRKKGSCILLISSIQNVREPLGNASF